MTDTEARQQNALAETWSQIRIYLLLTVAISAVFRYCIVHTGRLGAGGLYVTGLMWSPGLAGLIARYLWSAWHYPILLLADYDSGTPAWFGLTCFTVMVVGISFVFAWMRLKSGSLWTGMFLHASHNLWIQGIFDPLTTDTGKTRFVIGEFGIGLAGAAVVVAFITWQRRGEVS
jgi:Type II CAAX prenyl endopeptidase Rce1-like